MSNQDLMNQVNSIVDSLENPPLYCVEGHWWADSYTASYDDEMGLDECMQELYECR